jgi:hypothetical protein
MHYACIGVGLCFLCFFSDCLWLRYYECFIVYCQRFIDVKYVWCTAMYHYYQGTTSTISGTYHPGTAIPISTNGHLLATANDHLVQCAACCDVNKQSNITYNSHQCQVRLNPLQVHHHVDVLPGTGDFRYDALERLGCNEIQLQGECNLCQPRPQQIQFYHHLDPCKTSHLYDVSCHIPCVQYSRRTLPYVPVQVDRGHVIMGTSSQEMTSSSFTVDGGQQLTESCG